MLCSNHLIQKKAFSVHIQRIQAKIYITLNEDKIII